MGFDFNGLLAVVFGVVALLFFFGSTAA